MDHDLVKGETLIRKYQSDSCESINLLAGNYFFEAWGAQGGSKNNDTGFGGYSSGYVSLLYKTTIFACIGGQGLYTTEGTPLGGFNGGGDGFQTGTNNTGAGGGGGSTDLRFNETDISTRFLIAGGGGGDGSTDNEAGNAGGSGGGWEGIDGQGWDDAYGKGGNQTHGGLSAYYTEDNKFYQTDPGTRLDGTDGIGIDFAGGGGGGGYWGGSGSYECGGGGGSGFVSPFLLNGKTIAGNETMPQVDGGSSIGHKGHGAIRITFLEYNLCGITNQSISYQSLAFLLFHAIFIYRHK